MDVEHEHEHEYGREYEHEHEHEYGREYEYEYEDKEPERGKSNCALDSCIIRGVLSSAPASHPPAARS